MSDIVMDAITESMVTNGYDLSKPIDVWKNGAGLVVIDGHTRLMAAKKALISNVAVHEHHFDSIDDALKYAIANQRNRRNMTEADLFRCIEAVDKREQRGGDHTTDEGKAIASLEAIARSSHITADIVGTSRAKVEKARAVMDKAPAEIVEAVKNGRQTINAAYQETKSIEKPNIAVFNETNENIEWAKWSWNPVTGCKNNCPYCYAKNIAQRFYAQKFEPSFHKDRLVAPFNSKPKSGPGGNNVFVCSMADLFGEWVPSEWIQQIIDVCAETPQWNYLFLTKNPMRYTEFTFPKNCWLGATIDRQYRVEETKRAIEEIKAKTDLVFFISCEPLLEEISIGKYDIHYPEEYVIDPEYYVDFDWLIIGGCSPTPKHPEIQPEWEWVESLLMQARAHGWKVYFKTNLKTRPKEYPVK